MARLERAVVEPNPRLGILLGILFIVLNMLDAQLTGVAVALGSSKLNPIAATGFGSSMLLKGLIASVIVIAMVLLKRGTLLKPLTIGMLVICVWNGFAIWSWS
jgi:hypothetical protein